MSSKIHAVVDALGNAVKLSITEGQVHDVTEAPTLLRDIRGGYVVGDKAYDADSVVALIEANGGQAVIPPRSNRTRQRSYDRHLYRERHLVELFFNRIKQFRRVATRYDKTKVSYLAMVMIACVVLWLR